MSSSKVRSVSRVLSFTASWATNTLTVTTASTHYLTSGDVVVLNAPDAPQILAGVVTVVDGTSFTMVASSQYSTFKVGQITQTTFGAGLTGRLVLTLPRSTGAAAVVQSFVKGVGGAAYGLELSLDGIHWVAAATVTHATVDGDSAFNTIAPAWVYAALNVTSIGTATSLSAMYSA